MKTIMISGKNKMIKGCELLLLPTSFLMLRWAQNAGANDYMLRPLGAIIILSLAAQIVGGVVSIIEGYWDA